MGMMRLKFRIPFNRDVLPNREESYVGLNELEQKKQWRLLVNPKLSKKEISDKLNCSERATNRSFAPL